MRERAHKADLEEDKKRKTALRHSLEHSENVRRELSDKLHEKDAYIEKIEKEADKSREEAHQMEVAQAKLIEYLQDQLKEMEEKLKHCCDCNKRLLERTMTRHRFHFLQKCIIVIRRL